MDEDLRSAAGGVLAAAPCSVEMPAGTGKTHLLAAAATLAAEPGERSLVLTHTNAGVDAIRRRLRRFGVAPSSCRVETITSWAFTLVRSYTKIAGISVSELPDWSLSDDYIAGATKVARSGAIAQMHAASFSYLFVDEYQDCTLPQHEFVTSLAVAIPRTVVLGDRLQAIFTFSGEMASWDGHILPAFPPHHPVVEPRRWMEHNLDLGRWLLAIRPLLVDGGTFDFVGHSVPGLSYVAGVGPPVLAPVAHSCGAPDESVVLLDKWAQDVAGHASRLGGRYSVMEEIGGNFMRSKVRELPGEGDNQLATWLAVLAKACIVGLSGLDATVLKRLGLGEGVSHYRRPGLEPVLVALDQLRTDPTYPQLLGAARQIQTTSGLRMYRAEAWTDTLAAIALNIDSGESVDDCLVRVRERLRRTGRRSGARVASRTLLVKGLEYDHVLMADIAKIRDPCNLYVALSRARKTITVLGASSRITLRSGA